MNSRVSILTLTFLSMVSCVSSLPEEYLHLTSEEFTAQLEKMKPGTYVVLDVRTPEEYNSLHIREAINLNFYSSTFAAELNKLDKEKAYFVYCRSGNRSGQTIRLMQKAGFKTVYHLQRGITRDTAKLPLAE